MPRTVDHPRASLTRCLELARAVHELGDECTLARAAERLRARPGGAFNAIVSAAHRYGLLSVSKGRLRLAPAFRDYRLAYDDAERERVLAVAVSGVPLFRALLARYADQPLPEARLARVLVREHGVPDRSAERVAGYFLEATRAAGLRVGSIVRADRLPAGIARPPLVAPARQSDARDAAPGAVDGVAASASTARVRVHVVGPGFDSNIDVRDAADLELLRALCAKIERVVLAQHESLAPAHADRVRPRDRDRRR